MTNLLPQLELNKVNSGTNRKDAAERAHTHAHTK